MVLKAFILEVISSLPENVFYFVLLLLVAVWLLKDKHEDRAGVHRRRNAEDDDTITEIKDNDFKSDGKKADIRNSSFPKKVTKSRVEEFGDPDKMIIKWRNQIIKFAVTGRSCTGKSTFINLVRDVYPGDESFAEVGFGDCTMIPQKYRHPKNKHISFTDLPGFGTDTVTKEQFSKSVNLSVFDFVFIFFDSVIMEDDVWVVKQLQALGTPYCFVRSKIDLDSLNASDMGKTEIEVVNEIRKKLEIKFSNHLELKGSPLFLISNKKQYFHIGDIGPLFSFVAGKLPKDKSDALLFFLPILSPEMIEKKFQMLLERIKLISVRAAVVSAIPVPFLDTAINVYLVKKEIKYYIEIFLLDKDYVAKVPAVKKRHLSEIRLEAIVTSGLTTTANIGMAVLLSQADSLIPVIGTAIAAKATSVYVSAYLSNALLEMKNDAIAVYEHYTKH